MIIGKVSSAKDLLKLVQQLTEVKGTDFDYGSSGLMQELGLSDGLPVFLPTKERVNRQILDFWPTPRLYDSTLIVPPRNGLATPAVIAANAVMTGMPPNIAPYAAAVTHALCDPDFQAFNLQTTTNPVTPVIVVGGPSTEKNGFNNKSGALGGGNVNNASLGRTLKNYVCEILVAPALKVVLIPQQLANQASILFVLPSLKVSFTGRHLGLKPKML